MARHLTRRPVLPVRSVRPARPAVTVDHPMGTTEVPLHPATVVSLSPVWEDAFAALGDPVDVSFRGGDLVPAPWEADTPPGKLMSLPPRRYNRPADVLDEIRDAAPDLSGPDGAAVESVLYAPTVRSVPWLLELRGT